MKRLFLVAALTALSTFTTVQVAGASIQTTRHSRTHFASSHHQVRNAVIGVGSTWTYYDDDYFTGTHQYCEVLSFMAGHAFTGSEGDLGTWRGNVKLNFSL